MHNSPQLHFTDCVGPAIGAIVFIVIMSLVREPTRRNYNAIFVAGASGVYLSGGLGLWELLYAAVAGGGVAYLGLRSYRFIGLAWLMHAGWDLVHHLYGNVIWPFMPTSSFGCMIFDTLIAIWFFADAPSILALAFRKPASRQVRTEAISTGVRRFHLLNRCHPLGDPSRRGTRSVLQCEVLHSAALAPGRFFRGPKKLALRIGRDERWQSRRSGSYFSLRPWWW